MAAVIKAIGKPLNAFGVLAASNLTLIQLNTKITSKKPALTPIALPTALRKLKSKKQENLAFMFYLI